MLDVGSTSKIVIGLAPCLGSQLIDSRERNLDFLQHEWPLFGKSQWLVRLIQFLQDEDGR